MTLEHLAGLELGTRTVTYEPQDAALYALAVGANPAQLDLVYERRLVSLPTYGTALGMWGTSAAAEAGEYPPTDVLHAAQEIVVTKRLPPAATIEMAGRVANVYDKGTAAIVEVVVESEFFISTYSMYVRSRGGWGGDRGPSTTRSTDDDLRPVGHTLTDSRAAAFYRITGDLHPVHIDPVVAREAGLRAPILHGLCTFGTVVRAVSELCGGSPVDVTQARARFLAPVFPGDLLGLRAAMTEDEVRFAADVARAPVLAGEATIRERA